MEYQYKIDRKVTTWEREWHTIDAENQQEADAKAIKIAEGPYDGDDPYHYETLLDTTKPMQPEDNEGSATIEVLRDNETIWDNGVKH